ncbi:MAG: hypothetical protein KAS23_14250 [Anaerohalosphaera sp.]|nr:hypothetical protein [Anaerohalosphaera sp.]
MKIRKPEEKVKVPAYIVTFSDMVTLLLTFFLMLLSLANEQKDFELFKAGKASFVRAIETMGLGLVIGPKVSSQLDYDRPRYKIEQEDPKLDTRTIDPEQQQLQRSIKKLSEFLKNESKNKKDYSNHTIVTSIIFAPDTTELPQNAKAYLDVLAQDFRTGQNISLYIVGLQDDQRTDMVTASKRADNTAKYLKTKITNQAVNIYSLGADSSWFGKEKRKDDSHIWISAIKENNANSSW